ncbi:MAG: fused response regulator/phosphatase [Treponemataceae bacterium]|nr:fused response regulator/phosphatase [Treponemataceae bacterium]
MKFNPEIVLVDDEKKVTDALKREVELMYGSETYRITPYNNPAEAVEYIMNHEEDIFLVISDLRMPGMSGNELLTSVREISQDIQTVLLTAYTDIENIQKAISAAIQSLMFKPWTRESLLIEINKAYNTWKIKKENKLLSQRLHTMLKETGEFQQKIFSFPIPTFQDIKVDVVFIPLEMFHCGGDFFELRDEGGNGKVIIVGDVSGHGTKSAMVAVMLKTFIDEIILFTPTILSEPEKFLATLNNHFCRIFYATPEILIGMSIVWLNMETNEMAIVTAGLPHIYHRLHTGSVESIKIENPMLGAFPNTEFRKVVRSFTPGDRIFLFTDGLIESVPHFFTLKSEEIKSILENSGDQPASEIVTQFQDKLPNGVFADDVTFMTVDFLAE